MPIGNPGLILWLHVTTQIRLRPHKATLVVLNSHGTLWSIQSSSVILSEDVAVLQVCHVDDDGSGRCGLKAKLAIPRHVLDRHQSTVGNDTVGIS